MRRTRATDGKAVGSVCLGLISVIALTLFFAREYTYFVHGVAISATIIDVDVKQVGYRDFNDNGQGGNLLYEQRLRYQYRDSQGSTFTGETSSITETPKRYRQGQLLNIQYLNYSPATSRLAPSWWGVNWGLLLLILGIGAGVMALALWLAEHAAFVDFLFGIGTLAVLPSFKKRRRATLLRSPFPPTWRTYLRNNVGVYGLLTPEEQERLHNDVRIFLAEKKWEGCGGLTINEEIKVTIAAQACLLLLGREHDYFSQVRSILVYPSGFQDPEGMVRRDGLIHQDVGTLGEAWYRGPVVLAWDEVLAGGRNHQDGRNVVYHEFAHQLDYLGQWSDGPNRDRQQEQKWQEVMKQEYHQLVRDTKDGRATLLDQYGATSPAEFFAVATECFFERPAQMQRRYRHLYEALQDFYGQDPAARFARQHGAEQKAYREDGAA